MTFYTDGSCVGNGKANAFGGYGIVGIDDDGLLSFVRAKRSSNTTNNREELKAILYVIINLVNKKSFANKRNATM